MHKQINIAHTVLIAHLPLINNSHFSCIIIITQPFNVIRALAYANVKRVTCICVRAMKRTIALATDLQSRVSWSRIKC